MSDDPRVLHPPHYGAARFGTEWTTFTRLMMFNPGNAFKYIWRCEETGNPVPDLEKARVYWVWAWESGEPICPAYHRTELTRLYFAHLYPKVPTDWMARALGDILFEEWHAVGNRIDSRLDRYREGQR